MKVNIKAAPQHPYLRGVKGNREFTRVVTMLVAIDNQATIQLQEGKLLDGYKITPPKYRKFQGSFKINFHFNLSRSNVKKRRKGCGPGHSSQFIPNIYVPIFFKSHFFETPCNLYVFRIDFLLFDQLSILISHPSQFVILLRFMRMVIHEGQITISMVLLGCLV